MPCSDHAISLDWCSTCKENDRAEEERDACIQSMYDALVKIERKALQTQIKTGSVDAGEIADIAKSAADACERVMGKRGAESGHGARPFDLGWGRSIVVQCRDAGVPVFVKQMGAHVVDRNDRFDTCDDTSVPTDWWPWGARDPGDIEENIHGFREDHQGALVRLRLLDRKGGNMDEWPAALRVREFPTVRQ